MGRLLPRLQLLFVVLFAVISACGPLFFAQGSLVILAAALAGILLGIFTFLIGWRLERGDGPVSYPFPEWSIGIIKLFLRPQESHELKPLNRPLPAPVRRALGIGSMAVGALLVVALVIVSLLVMSA